MKLFSCESKVIQQEFKKDPPDAIYVAPSCLICALANDSSTSEFEFLLELSYRRLLQCLMTQRDIDIVTAHVNAHERDANNRNIRLQVLHDLIGRFVLVHESEDILDTIEMVNVSLPDFETGRLITAIDNCAPWYLTRSVESLVPLEEGSSLRTTILTEQNVVLTFDELDMSIQVVSPLLLM